MEFKNIKQLEKEIEEEEKIFGTLDVDAQKRVRKDFNRVTKSERLFIIENLKAKLQTLKDVCEEIKKLRFTEKGDFWNWEGQMSYSKNSKQLSEELLKKFQGEEE